MGLLDKIRRKKVFEAVDNERFELGVVSSDKEKTTERIAISYVLDDKIRNTGIAEVTYPLNTGVSYLLRRSKQIILENVRLPTHKRYKKLSLPRRKILYAGLGHSRKPIRVGEGQIHTIELILGDLGADSQKQFKIEGEAIFDAEGDDIESRIKALKKKMEDSTSPVLALRNFKAGGKTYPAGIVTKCNVDEYSLKYFI
ncbi:hypothetical protein KY317_02055 [Candidatus Woesearchaeota archaeon]|nr:hypothetical protein [Candidatus Woesearchaeota archaeon]